MNLGLIFSLFLLYFVNYCEIGINIVRFGFHLVDLGRDLCFLIFFLLIL